MDTLTQGPFFLFFLTSFHSFFFGGGGGGGGGEGRRGGRGKGRKMCVKLLTHQSCKHIDTNKCQNTDKSILQAHWHEQMFLTILMHTSQTLAAPSWSSQTSLISMVSTYES